MAVSTTGAVPERTSESRTRRYWAVDWTFALCVVGALALVSSVLFSCNLAWIGQHLAPPRQDMVARGLFALGFVGPVIACWRRAIRDNQMPSRLGAEPRYEHVSGWSALFLGAVVLLIALLVWWAASADGSQKIHALWGEWVVLGLSVAFVLVATAPVVPRLIRRIGLERPADAASRFLNAPADLIGRFLSVVDSFFVFAVASAAGANRRGAFIRYGLLLSVIGACAALGYLWEPPYAFVPIAWGFLAAFAVSRRWAWIEQDRELAMLNSKMSRANIRIGFDQNLRDEALVAFLSMFLLAPLALRQAQHAMGDALFAMNGADIDSMRAWIDFYGTELAKAVPFVDWAEVYHVEGDTLIRAETPAAKHAVFLTRVLIDLVFLAALLQAISSAQRDAQQRDLFYRKGTINRLDPFTEPDALRALVKRGSDGDWQRDEDRFDAFPRDYDSNRLLELAASSDVRLGCAANFLLERDNVAPDVFYQISKAAAAKSPSAGEMQALLETVEEQKLTPNVYQLDLARRRLVGRVSMWSVRRNIVSLIASAPPHLADRTEALLGALVGERREPRYEARQTALDALAPLIGVNLRVRAAIQQVASHDGARALRDRAQRILDQNPETA